MTAARNLLSVQRLCHPEERSDEGSAFRLAAESIPARQGEETQISQIPQISQRQQKGGNAFPKRSLPLSSSVVSGPCQCNQGPSRTGEHQQTKAPQCRHAEHCGAFFAGRIRSIVSAPRRTWPDRLPLPLSYGHDSGALVRRANQLCPATSQPSRPVPNYCRVVFGWRPTEDRHVRVLTELPNAAPMCDAPESSSIENVSRRNRAGRVVRGEWRVEKERPALRAGPSEFTDHSPPTTRH
jgi:hypothetical protein